MPATAVIGPWDKGLNLTSNRDLSVFLDKNELGEALNVVYTKEGFIQPRPGCKVLTNQGGIYDNYVAGTSRFSILGNIKLSTGQTVVLVQLRTASNVYIYKITDSGTVSLYWTLAGATVWFNHVIVNEGGLAGHRGIIFFAEQDFSSYVTEDFTLTAVPTMIPVLNKVPGSSGGMIIKDRLFLWKNDISKFMWSPPTYILDWRAIEDENTFGDDISGYATIEWATPEDGITAVQFLNNNFYIFKKNKFYMFTYQLSPKDDAYLRKISNEMGAFASTMYRNQVVVVNNRGVFRIDTTEFVDLQPQLNLRFEVPIDQTRFKETDIFITDFNNDVLVGFTFEGKSYYYCMNGSNGAWSRWSYDYATEEGTEGLEAKAPIPVKMATPGTRQYRSQNLNTVHQEMFFVPFDGSCVTYIDWKPKDQGGTGTYHLDTAVGYGTAHTLWYFPTVNVKTKASVGEGTHKYKKIYRTYLRFYLSEEPVTIEDEPNGVWTVSVNYNDYRLYVDNSHDPEQLLYLYPTETALPLVAPSVTPMATVNTAVYKRTYQLPIHQFRALEFVFELNRKWTSTSDVLNNPDSDRFIKQGYYFLLSGIIFDYDDRAAM